MCYSPVCQASKLAFDLHALATPPAFILSQDQTLEKFFTWFTIQVIYTLKTKYISGIFEDYFDKYQSKIGLLLVFGAC